MYPSTALIGVRSSWEIVATKCALERFACSAAARAVTSAAFRWERMIACAHMTPSESTNVRSSSSKMR